MNSLGLLIVLCIFVANVHSQNDRIPAVPLVVKSPYLSTWIRSESKQLFGDWPTFWNGNVRGMSGLVKVDGKTYEFMGHPTQDAIGTKQQVVQKGLQITPTQSIFTLEAGPVEMVVNFFTPIDPTDLKLFSTPGSYLTIRTKSTDGAKHSVQVYIDISAEWVSGNSSETAKWSFDDKLLFGELINFDIELQNQRVFQEVNDMAMWGTLKFFTDKKATYQTGDAVKVRSGFVQNGKLNNQVDSNFRPINDGFPVFAYVQDCDKTDCEAEISWGFAHVRQPAIQYTTENISSFWESIYASDSNNLITFMAIDGGPALSRAKKLDEKILTDAKKVGGESYQKIVSAALRQAFGGIELVGNSDKPWLMLKEISSDGNCQTVDVLYPHFPVLNYLNPKLIKLELDPLFDNQEKGFYPHKFSMHDLGSSYPRCIGHKDGKDEIMEVEESANMIIMTTAYLKASNDVKYLKQHYKILKQWSQYLVENGLYTGNALTTDDYLGRVNNSTNLSIKAIVALMAMSQIAKAVDNTQDMKYYSDVANDYIIQWQIHGQDSDKSHFKAGYNDTTDTSFLLYNFFPDRLLETNIVPPQVYKEQDDYYLKNLHKYGVLLTSTKTYSKNDWEMFYASATRSPALKQKLFDVTALWLRETHSTAPFSDWIDVNTGDSPGFVNRPVIGGVFAPLAVK